MTKYGRRRKRRTIDDVLLGEDPHNLLDVKAATASALATAQEINFEEINAFIDRKGRLPKESSENLHERRLARRLKTFQGRSEQLKLLKELDRYRLLDTMMVQPKAAESEKNYETSRSAQPGPSKPVTSLEDIFSTDAFSQLAAQDDELFSLKHVSKKQADENPREQPDMVAQYYPCQDFHRFEQRFMDVHQKIQSGDAEIVPFSHGSQIRENDMFILEGVLCLIAKVGQPRMTLEGKPSPRLRVIYENGTESNHLLQSLAKRLYTSENSRRIIPDSDSIAEAFDHQAHGAKRSGQIYFVKTLRKDPQLKEIPNLIKIGYTEQNVEQRIKNAHRDRTFLLGPVEVIDTIECYGLNPERFERLIHAFLFRQKVSMTLTDRQGRAYQPDEWFSVPFETAYEVAQRIVDGSIVNYRMDNATNTIVPKR